MSKFSCKPFKNHISKITISIILRCPEPCIPRSQLQQSVKFVFRIGTVSHSCQASTYLFTAVTINARPQRFFSFGFFGRQSTVTMVFTRCPRENSFSVSRALGGTFRPFQPFLQYFATRSDAGSCQDYEEYEFVECLSEKTQIIDLFTHYRLQPHKLFSLHARNSKSPFQIILVSLHPSFSDKGTFSVRVREKTMETVDWRPRKLRFQETEKKTLEGAY